MYAFSGGIAPNCRDDQCHQCPGHAFTISADLPYRCEHHCHTDPTLITLTAEEEMRGDAIREETRG